MIAIEVIMDRKTREVNQFPVNLNIKTKARMVEKSLQNSLSYIPPSHLKLIELNGFELCFQYQG